MIVAEWILFFLGAFLWLLCRVPELNSKFVRLMYIDFVLEFKTSVLEDLR